MVSGVMRNNLPPDPRSTREGWKLATVLGPPKLGAMCNLYSYTKPQDAARKLAQVERDIGDDNPTPPSGHP